MNKIKRISFLVICFFLLLLVSCSNMLSSYSQYFYTQQNEKDVSDLVIPDVGKDDEELGDGGIFGPDVLPGGERTLTIFEVFKRDGKIDEELLGKFTDVEQSELKAIHPVVSGKASAFQTADFYNNVMNINKIYDYAPDMNLKSGIWKSLGNKKYSVSGNNYNINKPMSVTAKNITFYMYDGINPLYGVSDIANLASYGDGSETRVQRFMFYEVRGDASIASLYNMLVCVDTYTRLVFPFAYPSGFKTIAGQSNPSAWAGLSKLFYNFDPIGYVDDNYNLVIEKWYTDEIGNMNNFPQNYAFTRTTESGAGMSPYRYTALVEASVDDAFLYAIREKIFCYRNNTKDTSVLETYTVSVDGNQITKTVKELSGTVSSESTYSLTRVDTVKSGTYGTATVNLFVPKEDLVTEDGDTEEYVSDELEYITFFENGLEKVCILQESFTDPGPLFVYRMKGKTFKVRSNTAGSSDYLHIYEFNSDASVLTHKIQKWRSDDQKTISTLNLAKDDCDKAVYNVDGTIPENTEANLADTFSTNSASDILYQNGIKMGVSDFKDPGPLFLDRVKGCTYTNDESSYVFSADGKSFTYDGKTYKYNAVHKGNGYTSVEYKYPIAGVNWYRIIRVENNDKTISMGTAAAENAVYDDALRYNKAILTQSALTVTNPEDVYLNAIKGKTFAGRQELGRSEYLETYVVSDDGKTIKKSVTKWKDSSYCETDTEYKFSSNIDAYSSIFETTTINVSADASSLTIGAFTAYHNFNDKGPLFLDRVKGKTYETSECKYVFSEDGKSFEFYKWDRHWILWPPGWSNYEWKHKATYKYSAVHKGNGYTSVEYKYPIAGVDWYRIIRIENDSKVSMGTAGAENAVYDDALRYNQATLVE